MTPDRFEQLSLITLRRHLHQQEVFELMNALLEARPELSAQEREKKVPFIEEEGWDT